MCHEGERKKRHTDVDISSTRKSRTEKFSRSGNDDVVLAVVPAFPQRLSFQKEDSSPSPLTRSAPRKISSPSRSDTTTPVGELDREGLFKVELDLPAIFGHSEIREIYEFVDKSFRREN